VPGCRRGQFSHLIAHFVWQPLNDAPIAPTRFRFAPAAVLPAGLRLSSSTGGKAKETKGKERKGKGLDRTHARTDRTDRQTDGARTNALLALLSLLLSLFIAAFSH
jgi:hypothetical protein